VCVKNKTFPPLEISSMSTETSSFKPAMTSKAASFSLLSLSVVLRLKEKGCCSLFGLDFKASTALFALVCLLL